MQVLITASTFPRRPDDTLPTFVCDQALALQQSCPGLQVRVLAPHDGGASRREIFQGLQVRRFAYVWPARAQRLVYPAILPNLRASPWLLWQVPGLFLAEFFATFRWCREQRPDVLYSHWFTPQAVTGALVARLLGIPHVFTTHSSDVAVWHRVPWLGPRLVRAVVRGAAAGTAVSRRTLAKLRSFHTDSEWGQVAHKMHILPMGVAETDLADPRPEVRARERAAAKIFWQVGERPVLLMLGRLTAKKGHRVLLAALRGLLLSRPDLLVLIGGEGELRPELTALLEAGLAQHVRLLGHVTGDDKRQLLRAADAFVLPSLVTPDGDAEGLPVALLEALAAGQVCVASDASGADDLLTSGVDGFIVPADDPPALAACLLGVLAMEPEAREALCVRALARAGAFTWPALAPRYHRLLFPGARQ